MNFEQLYADFVMHHYKNSMYRGLLPASTCSVEGSNTSCGDSIIIHLEEGESTIQAVRFEGEGCAISQASASVMAEILEGKTYEEAREIVESFEKMLRGESFNESLIGDALFFQGLKDHPMRVKCVTLPWKTAAKALALNEQKKTGA